MRAVDATATKTIVTIFLVIRPTDAGGTDSLLPEVVAHLADGGNFVVEAFVPDLTRFDRDQRRLFRWSV